MIPWHSFWQARKLLERRRVGRAGRVRAADQPIKEQPNRIGMAFDLDGGGTVLIGRTGSRRNGSRPGMLPKIGETSNMRGRWTNELDLGFATGRWTDSLRHMPRTSTVHHWQIYCMRGLGLGIQISVHDCSNETTILLDRQDVLSMITHFVIQPRAVQPGPGLCCNTALSARRALFLSAAYSSMRCETITGDHVATERIIKPLASRSNHHMELSSRRCSVL